MLVKPFSKGANPVGFLVLVDESSRHWSGDELAYIGSLAYMMGQALSRVLASAALVQQRRLQEILAAATAAFVDATPDEVHDVVQAALGQVRDFLGCESIVLLELDRETLTVRCSNEVTRSGAPIQSPFAPLDRDDPVVAKILDLEGDQEWPVDRLLGPRGDGHGMHIESVVNGRDLVALSVVAADTTPLVQTAIGMVRSLTSMLAQLRSRLQLERSALRRAAGDRLLGEIAADFVDRSADDADEGIQRALGRVGEFFECQSVDLWSLDPELGATLKIGWVADTKDGSSEQDRHVPVDHPTLEVVYDIETALLFESPTMHRSRVGTRTTLCVAPIRVAGEITACVASEITRELGMVVDPEVQEDVLGSLAMLVRQLWRRVDADRAVGRQLVMEDLLRRFATRLLSTAAEDLGGDERALSWLAEQLRMEHLSVWAVEFDDTNVTIDMLVESGGSALSIPEDRKHFALDLADTAGFPTDLPTDSWTLDEAPAPVRSAFETLGARSGRRVGFVRSETSTGGQNYLLVSRVGVEPITEHELSILTSALTIVAQHQARVAAERSLAAAFTAAPVAISLRESDTTFITCNAAYEELTGRTAEEMVGSKADLVVSADQVDSVYSDLDRELPFGRFEREMAFRRPDGTIVWADVRATPVQIPGRADPVLLAYSEDITDRRRNRQLLEYQATHDELTGLPNRRAFVGQAAEELANSNECAVLVLDLDRFKVVNDSLGHSVGDQLLITCADRIRLSLRPGDAVCRLGGDEFAILLRAPADPRAASVVAERLLRLLREPVSVGGEEVFPSASVGIAIPEEGDLVEDLLRYADAAMYQAKGHGRDQWVRFDRTMREAVVERIRTETDLRRAIDNGQLEVHYQPEFVLDTGGIVGVEALVRWRHPERGLLAEGTFISLAEETGLVVDLGRWVLGQATAQAARWVAEGHDIIMRVNLSARQLRAAVVGEVQQALAAVNLPADRLCLELTETTIMDDVQESARILQEFRDLGVQIAIDDFGTGFSSLAYLKRFPVDILKIDRAFVDGVGVDPDDTAIVHSIVGLAQTLRLEVVAEGIEDETQITELVRLGCRRGQGFHLARPAPADDVGLLLRADTPAG